jgi:uncharacterized membrane protein YebE (DUF533 family)
MTLTVIAIGILAYTAFEEKKIKKQEVETKQQCCKGHRKKKQ